LVIIRTQFGMKKRHSRGAESANRTLAFLKRSTICLADPTPRRSVDLINIQISRTQELQGMEGGIKIWRDPFRIARLKGRESRAETSFQIITSDKGSRHLR
jgi:hypothetical protein